MATTGNLSDFLSSTNPLTGVGGVVFTVGPYSNSDFATLLINAYKANYEVRIPNFEPFLQENIPSITSYQQNGTVEGTTVDIPAQNTDGSNFESDIGELVADHPESTAVGISEIPDSSSYGVDIVSGVVDIISNLPESFIAEIYGPQFTEVNPYTNVEYTTTTICYQNTSNGWVLVPSQSFDAYTGVEDSSGVDHPAVDNED